MSNEPSGESCITPPAARAENPYLGITRERAIQKIASWVSRKKHAGLPGVTLPGGAWSIVQFDEWLALLFEAVAQSEDASERTGRTGE